MEINVREDRRIVEVWLTHEEKRDQRLRAGLQILYERYGKQRYTVAVFESGERDLYQGTLDLLAYNKRSALQRQSRTGRARI